jgi:hypothetical protein
MFTIAKFRYSKNQYFSETFNIEIVVIRINGYFSHFLICIVFHINYNNLTARIGHIYIRKILFELNFSNVFKKTSLSLTNNGASNDHTIYLRQL